MKLNIGKILTRSWQIIWKHKILWIFGILAGFASGRGSGNGNSGNRSSSNGGTNPFSSGQFGQMEGQFREFIQQYMLIIIAVCLVIFILSLVFYALGMMGRIGMIKGVTKVEGGAESLAFGELWSESMPYFWRFFGLNFLISFAFVIIIILLFLLFILAGTLTFGLAFICIIPLLCIFIPVAWALSLILEQAQVAIVVEDLGILDGLKRGWEIFKSDIGGVIVLALILGVAGFFIGLIIALPLILAFLPAIFSIGSLRASSSVPATVWVSLACCVIYFPVLLTLSGILTAYIKTAWALTYFDLTKPTENTPIVLQADA